MAKVDFKPGNMLYPLPAVLVSCTDGQGHDNVLTIAWTGTVCSDPAMVSISVRPSRYSYKMIEETGEFVINLTTEDLVRVTDYCGVRSGADEDKFKACGIHKGESSVVKAPYIKESPVNIECRVTDKKELGSHTMFIAEVVAVHVDDRYMDDKGTFRFEESRPLAYSHGKYYGLGEMLGTFGYSIRKNQETKD